MEHGKKNRKFGRESKQRKELMRGLAESLILNGKITTTQAKAKSLKTYVEKILTKSKESKLTATRNLSASFSRETAKKLTQELGPKFSSRSGGYTRIINLPRRPSDGSRMAIIKFVD